MAVLLPPSARRLVPWLLAGILIAAVPARSAHAPVAAAAAADPPRAQATPPAPQAQPAKPGEVAAVPPSAPKPQPRPHSTRVAIDPKQVRIDDGDTVIVVWGPKDEETVRILGIDCPETRHPQHDIPYGQPFGDEARAFATGVFSAATRVELQRAAMLDPYGRTLGYLYVNGRNYSILVLQARLAEESVTRYGDNGFPQEAATVKAAAQAAGPLPFESPADYRVRMKQVADWMKAKGVYPAQ